MRLEVWGDHDDVIEVDQQCLPVESVEDLFHKSLESGDLSSCLPATVPHLLSGQNGSGLALDPAGGFTDSVKRLTHCTKISPRAVSRLGPLAS